MKPFRKNVAIAVDGGGIRGLIVTQALAVLEDAIGAKSQEIFQLAAGTSTGSIISAGIAAGITASHMSDLYMELGETIFRKTWRKIFFPLTQYRYSDKPLVIALQKHFGEMKMGDFWDSKKRIDLVITAYDLAKNKTCFIKPWKDQYKDWLLWKAVQASCTVPTYFPRVDGRYIDGGVGSYGNPCYIAAYEAQTCLNWDPRETTLISIGTGRSPYNYDPENPPKIMAWNWIGRSLDVFMQSAADQQVHLVNTYFHHLDFRRFQINLRENIEMDDITQMDQLKAYGNRLGRMILNDKTDPSQGIIIKHPNYF